jgi:hypothetical protein
VSVAPSAGLPVNAVVAVRSTKRGANAMHCQQHSMQPMFARAVLSPTRVAQAILQLSTTKYSTVEETEGASHLWSEWADEEVRGTCERDGLSACTRAYVSPCSPVKWPRFASLFGNSENKQTNAPPPPFDVLITTCACPIVVLLDGPSDQQSGCLTVLVRASVYVRTSIYT